MFALLKKEIAEFFSSLIGYIVITVFLIITALFMWVFPSDLNVFDTGLATMDTLFNIAPWVFLFLIPAITMRMFAEEKRTGTIETLFTKPISDIQIILAKYFAGLLLVFFAIIPTIVYFVSLHYFLSNHNVDIAGTFGSYIGLFFLAAVYLSIGLFASSLTSNQVVAFIIGVLLSFFFYIGFQYISLIPGLNLIAPIINYLGITEHYQSISRGVIDSRDIIYFLSVIVFFIFLTKFVLESRKW